MFNIIDRYIIGKILRTFVFSIVAMLCIIIVFDVSEKIDVFVKTKMSLSELITNYFSGFIVHIGNMFFPLFVLLTTVMVTVKMNQRSEIIALLSSGISFNRMLRPFFIGVGIIVLFSFYINFALLPKANKKRMAFENVHTQYASVLTGVHYEVIPGTIVSYKLYDFRRMESVTQFWMDMYEKDENGVNRLTYSMNADYAYGDSISTDFSFKNVIERYLLPSGDSIIRSNQLDTTLKFGLKDLGQRNEVVSTMTMAELQEYRDKEKLKGSAILPYIEIEIYSRTSNPLSLFILALIGICVSISPARSKVGLTILIGITSAALYFVFNRFAAVYATNSGLDPFLAVWIPNIILLCFGIYLYWKTPK